MKFNYLILIFIWLFHFKNDVESKFISSDLAYSVCHVQDEYFRTKSLQPSLKLKPQLNLPEKFWYRWKDCGGDDNDCEPFAAKTRNEKEGRNYTDSEIKKVLDDMFDRAKEANWCFFVPRTSKTDANDNLVYSLHTKSKPKGMFVTKGNVQEFTAVGFDPSAPLKIITHGWCGQQDGDVKAQIFNVGQDFLKNSEKINVLEVFWGHYANTDYFTAAKNAEKAAKLFSKFLVFLYKDIYKGSQAGLEKVHLIGFSLGCHMISRAAYHFQKETKISISFLTGLDPAGPTFDSGTNSKRGMAKGHAKWMDVIHTGSTLLGTSKKRGNFDFWPNGGWGQPGCLALDLICDHLSVLQFYRNSLVPGKSKFYPFIWCKSWLFQIQECLNSYNGKACKTVHMGGYVWDLFESQNKTDVKKWNGNYVQYTADPSKPGKNPVKDKCKSHET